MSKKTLIIIGNPIAGSICESIVGSYKAGALKSGAVITLGPAITPLLWLLAIAALTESRLYAAASLVFVTVHVPHQFFSFGLLQA